VLCGTSHLKERGGLLSTLERAAADSKTVGRKQACGDTGRGNTGIYVGVQTEECTNADIYVGTNGRGGSEHPDSCEEYIFAWLEKGDE